MKPEIKNATRSVYRCGAYIKANHEIFKRLKEKKTKSKKMKLGVLAYVVHKALPIKLSRYKKIKIQRGEEREIDERKRGTFLFVRLRRDCREHYGGAFGERTKFFRWRARRDY